LVIVIYLLFVICDLEFFSETKKFLSRSNWVLAASGGAEPGADQTTTGPPAVPNAGGVDSQRQSMNKDRSPELQPSNATFGRDRFVVVLVKSGKLLDTWAQNL
jgi:hypothetical protein